MDYEKIEYIKKDIGNDDHLRILKSEINDMMNEYSDKDKDTSAIFIRINEYFMTLSSKIFDTFVCEGGNVEYSYKSFKIFYLNIFYSFLKDFFINDKLNYDFFKKIDEADYFSLYMNCEDSLFTYIANYYHSTNDLEVKDRLEQLLSNIITYDCDSDTKEKRYKKILFITYKVNTIEKIKSNIESIISCIKDMHRKYTKLKRDIKKCRNMYYEYNHIKNDYSDEDMMRISIREEYTRESIYEIILHQKEKMRSYSNLLRTYEKQILIYKKESKEIEKLTQEDIEK